MPQWQAKATALLGVGLALGLLCESRPSTASLRDELAAALGSCRPLEGRVAGLAYASFPSCARPSAAGRKAIARIHLQIDRIEHEKPALLARALLHVAGNRWRSAANSLREAAAIIASDTTPARARIESDLAAVALTQASSEDDPYELTSALAAANRAVQLDPRLPEAYFNRALAEERLCLIQHSATDWQHYLRLDPDSPWAAEARRHLAKLYSLASDAWPEERRLLDAAALRGDHREVARLVARHRQAARLHVEDDLFAEWARYAEQGDKKRSADSLRQLTAIAQALREQTGDRLLDEAVSVLRQTAPGRRRSLIRGHLAYAQARGLITANRLTEAEPSLQAASRRLTHAGTPFAFWASFQQATVAYRDERKEEALRRARDLSATATAHSYSALAGRSAWLAALILLERTEVSAAIDALLPALAHFDRNGEISYQASILSMLATSHEYLGNPRQAWKFRLQALQAVVLSGDSARSLVLFGTAAQALAKEGMPQLALLYEDEVIAKELAFGDPLGIAEAYWIRGMIHHQAGAERQATADLGEAARFCTRIEAAATRLHTAAVIASTQGAIERQHDPAAAVQTLTRALQRFESEAFPFLKVEVLLDRALAFLALGDLQHTEADLAAGISEYERQRRRMHGTAPRVSFFDRAEQIFDVMIGFQLERRQRPDLAFAYAERAKARTLLDAMAKAPECSGPHCPERFLDTGSVLAALPPSTALLEIHIMEERTLIWLLCRGQLTFLSKNTGAARIAELAETLNAAARTGKGEAPFKKAASELYELLITPLAGKLPPDVGLIVATDKALHEIPLAALFNRRTGRFLIQEHPLAVAASASTYCLGLQRSSVQAAAETRFTALAVGNPEHDRARFPTLDPLPEAALEAERTATFYPGSVVLSGKGATASRFLAELDRHELVQFAGHAVSGANQQARLIFANSAGRAELDTGTIAGLHLKRPRLVILSACAAASGPAARLEGTASLARAFLAAGVPAVLANLWTIDDHVARAFSDLFHASFARQRDGLTALRDAQTAMIASPDARLQSPAAWAGFELFGAPHHGAPPWPLSLRSPPK